MNIGALSGLSDLVWDAKLSKMRQMLYAIVIP